MRVGCVCFFPDEIRLASASGDGSLKIWNVGTGNFVFDINDHQDNERTVAYSPNGTKLASGSDDQTVRVWNAGTGKPQTQPLSHDEPVCRWSGLRKAGVSFPHVIMVKSTSGVFQPVPNSDSHYVHVQALLSTRWLSHLMVN